MMRMKNNFNGIYTGLLLLTVTAGGAFLASCNSFKSCPEQVAQHMPVADSLFVAVDSAGFFQVCGPGPYRGGLRGPRW